MHRSRSPADPSDYAGGSGRCLGPTRRGARRAGRGP
jgi:hypothetical protein